MRATANHQSTVKNTKNDKRPNRNKLSIAAAEPELPLTSIMAETDAYIAAAEEISKRLNLPEAESASNEQRFVMKTLAELMSPGQQHMGDRSILTGSPKEEPICIFLRAEKHVDVSTSRKQADLFVKGDFSTLAWTSFEALARGSWHILAEALEVEPNDIGISHGAIITGSKFCLAAKFEIPRRHVDAVGNPQSQRRLEICISLLGNTRLWSDDALKNTDSDPVDGELINVAREARQEISTTELPFNCSLECDMWSQSIPIQKVLAAKRPPVEGKNLRCEIGKSTGFCTDRRLFHFKITKPNSLENISFDEAEFFDDILDVSGKICPIIQVTWMEKLEDKVITSRTLKKITIVTDALC